MPKYPKHKGWYSGDVMWMLPNKKKPIAYSTLCCSYAIVLTAEEIHSTKPNEIIKHFHPRSEETKVLNAYIEKGYGDSDLSLKY